MATNDENVSNKLSKQGCIIRIALLGHPDVGCNTLLSQFTNFPLDDRASYRQREVAIDGINVRILLFHWKNLETHLRNLTLESWGKMLHGAVFVFDITNHITLTSVETFLKKLSSVSSCAKAIVGNKNEFSSTPTGYTTPVVTEGKDIATKNSIPFFLTNAVTGENVEHVIVSVAAEALVAISNKTLPSLYLAPTHNRSEIKRKEIEEKGDDTDNTIASSQPM